MKEGGYHGSAWIGSKLYLCTYTMTMMEEHVANENVGAFEK